MKGRAAIVCEENAILWVELVIRLMNRDAALYYALGVGACSKDAVDDKELKYVYHHESIQVLIAIANSLL
ncbi:hypothetical protein SASPL_148523 [Salvia splendens]|uniref:Uncharacterized protein n=1 Tax=Salvia splendens TaxID=180675 RepID=A0A8X8Z465_SALSN|nr:hypothetical protein SASPL_148523 [Salvia splendens]